MSTTPILYDAIKALRDKIQTSAGAASAEELAYLATALERIGGRATVLEVFEVSEAKKVEIIAAIDTLKNTSIDQINAATSGAHDDVLALLQSSLTTLQQQVTAALQQSQTDSTSVINATNTALTGSKNATLSEVSSSLTAALNTLNATIATLEQQKTSVKALYSPFFKQVCLAAAFK